MIDKEWLNSLRFEVPGVGTVNGLAGVGSQFIALNCTNPDGSLSVLKSLRRELAWHLNEVPRSLGWAAGHDLNRIHRKLIAAAGSPAIDENTWVVNGVFNAALRGLLECEPVHWLTPQAGTSDPLLYLVQTDIFARRVQDVLSSDDVEDYGERGVEFFGELFPVDLKSRLAQRWREVQRIVDAPPLAGLREQMAPEQISRHPMFVLGAAVLEGLIEPEEFEATAEFVKGRFPAMRKAANQFAMQGSDWYDVLMMFVDAETTQLLADFASHFGFVYQFQDDGTA